MKELLTSEQASQYVRLSRATLAKLRCVGGGPAYYHGRPVKYDRADLDAWLDDRRRTSTSHAASKAAM